jgi:hypothetical protein
MGVAQKPLCLAKAKLLEIGRGRFSHAPDKRARKMFPAHPGRVGDLLHPELLAKMIAAKSRGTIQTVFRCP